MCNVLCKKLEKWNDSLFVAACQSDTHAVAVHELLEHADDRNRIKRLFESRVKGFSILKGFQEFVVGLEFLFACCFDNQCILGYLKRT